MRSRSRYRFLRFCTMSFSRWFRVSTRLCRVSSACFSCPRRALHCSEIDLTSSTKLKFSECNCQSELRKKTKSYVKMKRQLFFSAKFSSPISLPAAHKVSVQCTSSPLEHERLDGLCGGCSAREKGSHGHHRGDRGGRDMATRRCPPQAPPHGRSHNNRRLWNPAQRSGEQLSYLSEHVMETRAE